ncbi:MAG TPA: hypothetical protein VF210_07140 [Pseudomonadales bacterium]
MLVGAAAAGAVASASPCSGPPYRAFDFRIGDWVVERPDGVIAGRNRISVEQSGCLLIERWQDATGSIVLEGTAS